MVRRGIMNQGARIKKKSKQEVDLGGKCVDHRTLLNRSSAGIRIALGRRENRRGTLFPSS
jgi:hypothetical protein